MQWLDYIGASAVGWATRSSENLYLHCTTPIHGGISGIACRFLDVVAATTSTIVSSVCAITIGAPCLAIASRRPYYHITGTATEKTEAEAIKVASWNINGIPWNQVVDKTAPFYSRVEGIVSLLHGHDVIMLQEAFGDSAYMILKSANLFNKAYGRSGIQVFGLDSGQLCLTTLKVVNFQFVRFNRGSNVIARGFSVLETEKTVFIQTHLRSGAKNGSIRVAQMNQIKKFVETLTKPYMVMGDFNIGDNRDAELHNLALDDFERHGSAKTCFDNDYELGHDLILLQKRGFRVNTYEEKGSIPGDSDHKLLSLEATRL